MLTWGTKLTGRGPTSFEGDMSVGKGSNSTSSLLYYFATASIGVSLQKQLHCATRRIYKGGKRNDEDRTKAA